MNLLIGPKTYFSLGEGVIEPAQLLKEAHARGFRALAITDTNGLDAMPQVAKKNASLETPLSLIVGCAVNVVNDLTWRKVKGVRSKNPFFYAGIYAMNEAGLSDIMGLLSLANDDAHFYGKPQINFDELCETYARGNVVVSTGSLHSMLAHKSASALAEKLASIDSGRFFVEFVGVDTPYYHRINELALQTMERLGLNAFMSFPALCFEGGEAQRDTMEAVLSNANVKAPYLQKMPTGYSLPESPLQLTRLLARSLARISGIKDSRALAARIVAGAKHFLQLTSYRWAPMPVSLPEIATDPFRALAELCKEGWRERVQQPMLGFAPTPDQLPQYMDRLKYELAVIQKMGFSNYFLLVRDTVNWCKEQGIVVGPGRGSVGGSLIAYLLGITDVDPIRFGLFFERFINPERIDLPDIDLDFMSSRRSEVIAYLQSRHGIEYTAGISNYGTMQSAGILRAVAKAHGLAEFDYRCSKLIPKEHGQPVSLETAMQTVAEVEQFALSYPEVWRMATAMQGIFRNNSQHAAGVIVAGVPITERAVVYSRAERIVNWDKEVCEDFGLVKLDILGLSTLDLLALAAQYIQERHGIAVDLRRIPLDDPKVLEAFGQGNTTGVFQFESPGMKRLLKALASEATLSFADITAATALYRPGPMDAGLMDRFVAIKQGNDQPFYLHPSMQPALEETSGVIVYQEQVMQIARDLAGFTMAESDHLRKAMGKKDPEKMAAMRDKWVQGCQSTSGLPETSAAQLFDQIEMFAGYAFNKSHSVEYSIISYWSMWTKVHYPAEFLAAALTILDEDKQQALIREASKMGVIVAPPDINKSSARFEIHHDTARGATVLYAPFQAILGLSEKASAAILEAKAKIGRPFTSKAEFIATVARRACNVRSQDSLDRVGAFAEIEPGQLPALHPDRVKDQRSLLPGVIIEAVKADRKIDTSPYVLEQLKEVVQQCSSLCNGCSLAGQPHAAPRLGGSPKVMIVVDSANWSETDKGKFGEGEACESLRKALGEAGFSMRDVYVTGLVKAQKPKGGQLANDMINGCSGFLDREIELLKPPVILAMGGKATRHLSPEAKGGWEELFLKDVYDKARDCTIVFGINPMMTYMDPGKQRFVNEAVRRAFELVA